MTQIEKYITIGVIVVVLLGAYALAGGLDVPGQVTAENGSSASQQQSPRIITAEGEGTVEAEPDTAVVRLGVETQEATALEAQQANNELMNRIITVLKDEGVGDDDLTTTQFNVHPVYDHKRESDGPPEVVAFRVSNILEVETKQLDAVGTLIDAATGAGANRVHGVNFFVEDTEEYELQALEGAVKNARAKAEVMASAAGIQINEVLSITEHGAAVRPPQPYGMGMERASDSASTPIHSGDQTITVRVTVQFSH